MEEPVTIWIGLASVFCTAVAAILQWMHMKRSKGDAAQNSKKPEIGSTNLTGATDNYKVVELAIGTVRSSLDDRKVKINKVRFIGKLLAEEIWEGAHIRRSDELYERPNGLYVVYSVCDHFDYCTAHIEGGLTLERVQTKYPVLATKAGLAPTTEL